MPKHKHKWMVQRVVFVPPCIKVSCNCGALGHIDKYSADEYFGAYYAPSKPYPWLDPRRVIRPEVVGQ